MPDLKISELPTTVTIEATDLFAIATNLATTPVTKAIEYEDLVSELATDLIDELVGKKTVFLPANAMFPSTSNGCGEAVKTELTPQRPEVSALPFDGSSDEYADFYWSFPKSWDNGTITFQAYWTGLVAGAGTVKWNLSAVAVSDDDTIDVAYGTEVEISDTFIAINDLHISTESAAVTVAGSPAQGDMIYYRVRRNATGDTRSTDANLIGIKILYSVTGLMDD